MASEPTAFIRDLAWHDVPAPIQRTLRRFMLDTAAVAAAGVRTETGRLLARHAARVHGPGADGGARLLFDGRRVSPVAAAMAGAGAIDSFDAHDGHPLTKGHAGVAALPAALAFGDALAPSHLGELLTRLLIGYEVGLRAGIALHRTQPQYHTSGAWNALAAAAISARALGLDPAATRSALGAAEFYGPRGLMMTVIDRPSMLKDGSQAGAAAGVEAALLARDGFQASPPTLLDDPAAADLWGDLGTTWRLEEQYAKPYPVCRWAQPAMEAAASLRGEVAPDAIAAIRIRSFAEAVRLAGAAPATSDAAQYAIAYPVAALLRHGRLGAEEIDGPALSDPATLDLARRIELIAEPRFDARFPAERWASVEIETTDGRRLASGDHTARGDAAAPLTDAEIETKLHSFAGPLLPEDRIARLRTTIRDGDPAGPAATLLDDLLEAPASRAAAAE